MNGMTHLLEENNKELGNEVKRLTKIIKEAIKYIEEQAFEDDDLGKIYTKEEIQILKILKGDNK